MISFNHCKWTSDLFRSNSRTCLFLRWLKPATCRLNIVSAVHSCWLTVGTATSTILASICCTTRGHSEWVLIPTQPCCGGKTFFPFSERRQTATSTVAGNLQATQPASWKHQECSGLRGPQTRHGPLWLCTKLWLPGIGTKLPSPFQLDGFGAWSYWKVVWLG